MIPKAIAWAIAHPVEAATLAASAVALLRGLYALLARILAPYPRARAVVEAVAALAPDVLRFGVMVARAVTGLPIPSPSVDTRDAEIAALRSRVAELAASRTDASSPLVGRPGGSSGRASVGALVALAVGGPVALLPVAAAAPGCGPGRELVMRVAPGVPSPSSCSPAGASRCEGAVPVVCSASGRWWPATPASAPCARGCVVGDAGAYCAAADGGAR